MPPISPKAAKEQARLAALKKSYKQAQTGKTGTQLTKERKTEQQKLAEAKEALKEAKAKLAKTTTPLARQAAQRAVTAAEANLRTHYAKSSVINSVAPVPVRQKELHDYADTLSKLPAKKLQTELAAVKKRFAANDYAAGMPGRIEKRMDEVKIAIGEQALAKKVGKAVPVAPLDKTRNPGNVVFDGPGMFIASAPNTDPHAWAQKLKAAGVSWVALQVNNGGVVGEATAALDAGWAAPFKAAGLKVGFWGVSYTEPEKDAIDAAQLTRRYGGDFYIADCEGHFQMGQGDIARNKRFVDAFQAEATRQGIGNIPRALSSMGRVALDMKPWLDNGWDSMPQAYWNSYEHYSPSSSAKFWEESGWPKGRIHPTIATYDGSSEGNARPKSIAEYAADLKKAGTKGVSYYLPESYLDDAKLREWTDAMRSGMNG